MAIEGVDYSYDPPNPTGLVEAGKKFVVRYGAVGNTGKHLTAAEVTALRAAGLAIVANVEETASAYRGASAGTRHATAGASFFRSLGFPVDTPIYFSVDWDAGSGDWADIDAALRASAQVLGVERVGVYGSYDVIEHCAKAGTARWFWQTYAWSGGRWSTRAHLQQYRNNVSLAGGTVDLTRAMTADYGQWGAAVTVSQNGWTVDTSGSSQDTADIYPGIAVPNGVRKGDVAVVFRYLARRFHAEVEPLHPGWCWGWFVKVVAGGTDISNHSSGTAIDLNAPDHPLGAVNTFSAAQQTAIHKILKDLDGIVRWGGDYTGRHDDMHFEIIKPAAAVKVVADRIRAGADMTFEADQVPIHYPHEETYTGPTALGMAKDSAQEARDLIKALTNTVALNQAALLKAIGAADDGAAVIAAVQAESAKLQQAQAADAARDAATAAAIQAATAELAAIAELLRTAGGDPNLAPVLERLDALDHTIATTGAQAGQQAATAVLNRMAAAQDAEAAALRQQG